MEQGVNVIKQKYVKCERCSKFFSWNIKGGLIISLKWFIQKKVFKKYFKSLLKEQVSFKGQSRKKEIDTGWVAILVSFFPKNLKCTLYYAIMYANSWSILWIML